MLDIIINQTCITIMMVAIGYICRKKKIFDSKGQKCLTEIILNVALPCTMVSSAGVSVASIGINRIFSFCIIVFSYFLLCVLLLPKIAKHLSLSEDDKKQIPILITFPSSAFMGIPIASALYQESGIFLMGVFSVFYSMSQYTYGIGIYTGFRIENIIALFKNPLLIASMTMIILFSFQIKVPYIVQRTLSTVGAMTTPLSMIVVGSTIAQHSLLTILKGKKLIAVSFLRLIIIPSTVILIMYIAGIDSMIAILLSMIFALPSSSTSAVIADKYSGNSLFPSQCVAQTMILFLLTMPVITVIVNSLWSY